MKTFPLLIPALLVAALAGCGRDPSRHEANGEHEEHAHEFVVEKDQSVSVNFYDAAG